MIKKIIRREKLSRDKKDEIKYGVLGAEIRSRRLKLSRTLASLVKEVCSISYLCKLEKNRIKANKQVLMKLCSRVDLDERQTKSLLSIRDLLLKMVKAFKDNDVATLEIISDDVKVFDNYRSKLIMFIYCIYNKKLEKANLIDKDLLKVIGGMNNDDLKIYFCFHAVLSFYNQSFKNASDDMDEILQLFELNNDLKVIIYQYKLYVDLKLNSSRIIDSYNNAKNLFLQIGDYKLLDNANYILALHYLQNKEYIKYSTIYKSLNDISYRYTLLIIVRLIFNIKMGVKKEWLRHSRPLGVFSYNYFKNKKTFKDNVNELTDLSFDYDFNPIIMEYLSLETELERFNYINDIALRNIISSHDASSIKFFINEYSKLCFRHTKYKAFYEFYEKVKGMM